METLICAPACDQGTAPVEALIREPLEILSKALSKDYGGQFEHFCIELELSPTIEDMIKRRSFRFQKRVAPSRMLAGLNLPYLYNVAHYSIRPDYFALAAIPSHRVIHYVLNLIYASTSILIKKNKRLAGFNAQAFRHDFIVECGAMGYEIDSR